MRLAQFIDENGKRALAVTARGESRLVKGARTTLDLARQAIAEGVSLRKLIADRGVGKPVDLARALKERRVLAPIDHKDPAHVFVTGTGPHPSRLGGGARPDAQGPRRSGASSPTRCGCSSWPRGRQAGARAKPARSRNGSTRATARSSSRPEATCQPGVRARRRRRAGDRRHLYDRCTAGAPVRIGFALGNEFSDHVTERQNYLWLAHSKLRPASLGPELLIGDLPVRRAAACRASGGARR